MENLPDVQRALHSLRNVPGLTPGADNLLLHELLKNHYVARVIVPQARGSDIQNKLTPFREVATALRVSLQAALPAQDPNAVVVELPNVQAFAETAEWLNELSSLFSRIGAGKPVAVEVQSFDSGSLIVELVGQIARSVESVSPLAAAEGFAAMVFFLWNTACCARVWRRQDEEVAARMRHAEDEHQETMNSMILRCCSVSSGSAFANASNRRSA